MSRFCLHWETTFATSAVSLRVQRSPLARTTRTVLEPLALMWAKERVWFGYQVWAWLTPRITKSFPSASSSRPFCTRKPVGAAWAGGVRTRKDRRRARRVAATVARRGVVEVGRGLMAAPEVGIGRGTLS